MYYKLSMNIFNDYVLNENKCNNLLDDLERDRTKIFNEIKNVNNTKQNKIKNKKLVLLQKIQNEIINYKKILQDEQDEINKY